MKHMKNKLVAIFLVLVLVLSALVFCIFGIDYKITATAVAVWAGVLLLRFFSPKYFGGKYTLYAIYFISLYVLFYVAGLLSEEYLEYKVYQFDINHDLIFSPEEQTAEWHKYWDPYIGDGARRVFRPVMTFFYSLGGTLLLVLLMWVYKTSKKQIQNSDVKEIKEINEAQAIIEET